MVERTFSLKDQQFFADLSGDYNPMHVDPMAARRLMYGSPVVHGANLALWALEVLVEDAACIATLDIRFLLPLRIDEPVLAEVRPGDAKTTIVLSGPGRRIATIAVTRGPSLEARPVPQRDAHPADPMARSADSLAGLSGAFDSGMDLTVAQTLYPRLFAAAPDVIATLAAASLLVGMECPGLNSVFSELRMTRRPQRQGDAVGWRVDSYDDRFARLVISADAPDADLRIVAFMRPEPQSQPTTADLEARLGDLSFAGRRAVVVGGSRGLGELAAKLLAAGGAEVLITYAAGIADAEAVAADITAAGGKARIIRHDVLGPPDPALEPLLDSWTPTHLYYMATPPIFVGTRQFSPALYRRFCDFYIDGFVATLEAFRRGPLQVFYPSTVAVDEVVPALAEYSAAKAAGEVLCRHLAATDRQVQIDCVRLPRLPTDQTATIFPVEVTDPVPVLLDILATNAIGDAP